MAFDDITQDYLFTIGNYKQLLPDILLNICLVSFSEKQTDSLIRYLNYVRVIQAHKFPAWKNIDYNARSDIHILRRFAFSTSGYVICMRKTWGAQILSA
jgi:hypothetical protein